MFFHGEDAVADDLAPFIDAAPREEQKYFLATQQVDEARHAIFFKRFMHEVVGRGDGSIARRRCAPTEPELTWGFRKTFALLDEITGALRARPLAGRARARGDDVPRRRRGAARPARPALHLRLPGQARPAARLPRGHAAGRARRAAPHRLRRQAAARPRAPRSPAVPRRGRRPDARASRRTRSRSSSRRTGTAPTPSASASRSRRSTPRARARSRPKLRSAGLPLESLPGPSVFPLEMTAARARRVRAGDAAGRLHRAAATARRRATRRRWSCCSTRSRAPSTTARRRPGRSPCSGSSPTPSRGTCAWTTARPRRPPGARAARGRRGPLPLRGLGRRRRRPARPAPRAGHRPAAPARLAARAVGGARAVRLSPRSDLVSHADTVHPRPTTAWTFVRSTQVLLTALAPKPERVTGDW